MQQLYVVFFGLATAGYLAATLCYMWHLTTRSHRIGRWAPWILLAAAVVYGAAFGLRWLEAGHPPLVNLFDSLTFYSWLTVVVYLVIERLYGYKVIGAFVTPLAFVAIASATMLPKETQPLIPVLRSAWLPIHVGISFLAYTVFTIAFAMAIVYLLQERELKAKKPHAIFYRLPPLETMERIGYSVVGVGFPFMTLAIATGAVWAEQAWGSYWSWDPKQTMSLVTWLIFAAYFHFRNVVGWRGKRAAWLVVAGFAAVVFTFLGVNLLSPGRHNFI
ncbi:MAG: c-type cytochrome biogenesis protein CcsB [Chloroflexi bacterium]|nr:c-type cytochrome biogenesis protein CcsB [Chloroflexota bacterium]